MPEFAAGDGARLHFTDDGDGVPVIALAGLTRNGRDFDYLAPHLRGVRLIRPDYRGRGRSEWTGPDTYTIATEAEDVLALMDHLELPQAGIIGTSRGGLIAMLLGATARDRLAGVCLVDIGPRIAPAGLEAIKGYLGRRPRARSLVEAAAERAKLMAGFANVPDSRWQEEVAKHYVETEDGLDLTYDPALREAVLRDGAEPAPDLWPLFDALEGLPLATIRGANSDLLDPDTFAEMRHRRPDMIAAEVPDRGHVPFLDEPAALDAIAEWTERLAP